MLDGDRPITCRLPGRPFSLRRGRAGRRRQAADRRGADVNERNDKGNAALVRLPVGGAGGGPDCGGEVASSMPGHTPGGCEDVRPRCMLPRCARPDGNGGVSGSATVPRNGRRTVAGKKPIDHAPTCVAADKDAIVDLLDRPVIRDPFQAAGCRDPCRRPDLPAGAARRSPVLGQARIRARLLPAELFRQSQAALVRREQPDL